jgi:hypothetical protein
MSAVPTARHFGRARSLILAEWASGRDYATRVANLQGTWVMVGLEVNGETVPEKKLAGTTLVFAEPVVVENAGLLFGDGTIQTTPRLTSLAMAAICRPCSSLGLRALDMAMLAVYLLGIYL